jgi:hypothetical protein
MAFWRAAISNLRVLMKALTSRLPDLSSGTSVCAIIVRESIMRARLRSWAVVGVVLRGRFRGLGVGAVGVGCGGGADGSPVCGGIVGFIFVLCCVVVRVRLRLRFVSEVWEVERKVPFDS